MRTFSLRRHARARVWIDEASTAAYSPHDVAKRTVPAGTRRTTCPSVTIEMLVPMGGMAGYGLLGVLVSPGIEGKVVQLDVPWCGADTTPWHSPLVLTSEQARIGIPQDLAEAVIAGLDQGSRSRLAPSTVRVVEAVHGMVGSSPIVMSWLGRTAIEILLISDHSDEALTALLERPLAS